MATSFAPFPVTDLVRISVVEQGPSVRLVARGEIDSSSAPELGHRLDAVLDGQPAALTVDLCGVTFLDSAGLSVLATAHRRATGADISMRVLASSRAVVRPLQITGLWRLLGAELVESAVADQSVA